MNVEGALAAPLGDCHKIHVMDTHANRFSFAKHLSAIPSPCRDSSWNARSLSATWTKCVGLRITVANRSYHYLLITRRIRVPSHLGLIFCFTRNKSPGSYRLLIFASRL